MGKHSATYEKARHSAAIIKAAQEAGASRVEIFDPDGGRTVVTFGNGSITSANQPNSDGVEPPETPDELRRLL
jgi:hypothetical protein